MDGHRVISLRPPYIPITLTVRGTPDAIGLDALIDTGFDGDVLLPPALIPAGTSSLRETRWRLADGSRVVARSYVAELSIGSMTLVNILVTALGDEPLVGRGVTRYFAITFDHDRPVIVES